MANSGQVEATSESSGLILVVEDEPKIASLLIDYLARANFETHWLETGGDVVDWIREHKPDLMLLDLMLPERDGMSICKEIRTFSDVPIMMVTARVDEIDRLLGLELGADDYICIPFSPREVVARVKTILRRIKVRATSDSAYLGIELDEGLYRASINGNPLNLTPVEFRLLSVLFRHPGRVFSRDQLMDRVYTDNRA
jgi:two-component system response regulator BaeR